MEFKKLEIFLKVVELQSFTKASCALDIAQSVVSRTIRTLEKDLNQVLFYRDGHGVRPMPSALVLAEHAKSIFRQLDLARSEVGNSGKRVGETVRVGLPSTLARLVGRPVVADLFRTHPAIKPCVLEGLSFSLMQQLEAGVIDLAIGYHTTWRPNLQLTTVFEEPMVFIGLRNKMQKFPAASVDLKTLSQEPLIIATRPNNVRMLIEMQMAALMLAPNVVLEVDCMPLILDLVADGLGYAILPLHTLSQVKDPSLYDYRFFTPEINTRVMVATFEGRSLRKPVQTVKEAFVSALKNLQVAPIIK
ncbi:MULTISPECIES: LysR family transcriptional regulator [unclassified Polaromonas]|uniref:LysR family transcriptional regulator n=1 Tax=unclassified Polaromonas TaxID=2638319 RepID=UPI000F08F535|nr:MULTISPECIES: LysR family transcriptional regulator [unclassified Polaromonas]AYQ30273.1 LysR family transcriptional regulator [Polaromonas sp. SP1]QGJ18611.1 LysR family transcriptional regulator [Polaromonas sp. Pch-P]